MRTNETDQSPSRDSRWTIRYLDHIRPRGINRRVVAPVVYPLVRLQLLPTISAKQAVFWNGCEWDRDGKQMGYAQAKEIQDDLAETRGIVSLIVKS